MTLPFTTEQFLEVFRQYNTSVWPMQVLLTALAVATVTAAARGVGGRFVALSLAAQWAWTGVVYHWMFFAPVNPAAKLFAVLWLAGAAAFAWNGLGKRPLAFGGVRRSRLLIAGALIGYALVVYPIIGHFGGRAYPYGPTYGAPCPVTITTLGLLWLARSSPRHLLVAPLLWAAIASVAAFSLGVIEDTGLLLAGLSGVFLALRPAATGQPSSTVTGERV